MLVQDLNGRALATEPEVLCLDEVMGGLNPSEITEAMKRLGKTAEFVGGQRVTDAETVEIVEMVLAGLAGCLTAGVAAVAQNRNIQLHKVAATVEGRDAELGGDVGNGHIVHRGAPERLPGALLELGYDVRVLTRAPAASRIEHRLAAEANDGFVLGDRDRLLQCVLPVPAGARR